jgi:hypothetical protein
MRQNTRRSHVPRGQSWLPLPLTPIFCKDPYYDTELAVARSVLPNLYSFRFLVAPHYARSHLRWPSLHTTV